MESERGVLIGRVFRMRNLMDAKVTFTTSDITAEEARVLELIELENPRGDLHGA